MTGFYVGAAAEYAREERSSAGPEGTSVSQATTRVLSQIELGYRIVAGGSFVVGFGGGAGYGWLLESDDATEGHAFTGSLHLEAGFLL